jgi:N,N-dimethylformamidase
MTRRRVRHEAMPVCGFVEPWGLVQGDNAVVHLSSEDADPLLSIVSLDRADTPLLDGTWIVERQAAKVQVQELSQGGWIEIPIRSYRSIPFQSIELEFEFLLSANSTPRVLVEMADITLLASGDRLCLSNEFSTTDQAMQVRTNAWHLITMTVQTDCVDVKVVGPEGQSMISQSRSAELDIDSIRIGSDRSERWPTANARYARPTIKFDGLLAASWRFPPGPPVTRLQPIVGAWGELRINNAPTFGVSSGRWTGNIHDPRLDPDQYDAVHCHDTDLAPLDWAPSHQVKAPSDAKSGIYAVEVRVRGGVERLPFFLRPRAPQARIAFLAPTLTYLAYADEALPDELYEWRCDDRGHRFAQENRLLSLYDRHNDGSGVSLTTTRRPKATLRDDYRYPLSDSPHLLPVDLRLLRFCRREGIEFDVLTDHDLHHEGARALIGYQGVFTGSHPEYWTGQMLDALSEFLGTGRSLAYLGGNGFMWVSAMGGDALEVRRGQGLGARTWDGRPGETNLALTGEIGGMWRERGRSEFNMVGTGMSMMGFSRGRPFRRTPESYEQQHDWIFDGVQEETFGATGSVLGAAAGYEVDRRDIALGTHPDTVGLALATGFDDGYQTDPNEFFASPADRERARVAEMVIRATPEGGFIFGVGSVAWCGALPEPGERNGVGVITANVLRRLGR